MKAITEVRRYLQGNPDSPSSEVLARLSATLAEEGKFPLRDLYEIDGEAFELAIELMKDWRLDRYYAADIRLFDGVVRGAPRAFASDDALAPEA